MCPLPATELQDSPRVEQRCLQVDLSFKLERKYGAGWSIWYTTFGLRMKESKMIYSRKKHEEDKSDTNKNSYLS